MNRKTVIDILNDIADYPHNKLHSDLLARDFYDDTVRYAIALLKEQNNMAIEDRQLVVRCRDCIHWDKECTQECNNSDSVCFHNGWCKPDWFCADGERKEGR